MSEKHPCRHAIIKLQKKKKNSKIMAHRLQQTSHKEDKELWNKYMEKCSSSWIKTA